MDVVNWENLLSDIGTTTLMLLVFAKVIWPGLVKTLEQPVSTLVALIDGLREDFRTALTGQREDHQRDLQAHREEMRQLVESKAELNAELRDLARTLTDVAQDVRDMAKNPCRFNEGREDHRQASGQ